MKKYTVEFLGTFFLVLAITLAVGGGAGSFAPIAIGATLMVMVYAGGHISGAHYNPAVTIGIWLRGKITTGEILPYIVAQCIGGVLASFVGGYLVGHIAGAPGISAAPAFEFLPGLLAEFLGTFALVFVILNVATAKSTEGNSYYGLAIGFTVLAGAYSFGGISGGSFNPAVSISLVTGGMTDAANLAPYFVGQFVAGVAGAFVFKFVNPEE